MWVTKSLKRVSVKKGVNFYSRGNNPGGNCNLLRVLSRKLSFALFVVNLIFISITVDPDLPSPSVYVMPDVVSSLPFKIMRLFDTA